MKLRYRSEALSDLEDIYRHIAKHDLDIARSVVSRIRTSLDRLVRFPRSGRIGLVEGTRELVVPNLPYIVVYELVGDRQIDVIAVFHDARKRP